MAVGNALAPLVVEAGAEPAAGVGAGAAQSGAKTTLGGIGTGYIYAAWKGQIAYTTPNFNGFQATVGITNPNQGLNLSGVANQTDLYQDRHGLEGKAAYSFSGDAVTGKVWVSGFSQKVNGMVSGETAYSADIGANLKAGAFDLTGYYYTGEGAGTTAFLMDGFSAARQKRDSDGGYLQATYKLPIGTKIGLAYGVSKLDRTNADIAAGTVLVSENNRVTLGAYHPITKHLNLVAEYNDIEAKAHTGVNNKQEIGSLGAILFF